MRSITNVLLALATVLMASNAFATHKSWVMKNGASDCQFEYPVEGENNLTSGGPIYNSRSSTRSVSCPVTLANRWVSTGTRQTYFRGDSQALEASVIARRSPFNSSSVYCNGRATSATGSLYYGSTVYSSSTSYASIQLAPSGDWGSSLESNSDEVAKGMHIRCSLPQSASLVGYRVKMCQNEGCMNPGSEEVVWDGSNSARTAIQTSGIECVGTYPGDRVAISSSGIRAIEAGYSGNGGAKVFCPLIPASDDSYETTQYVYAPTIYYSGMSTSSNCVSNGTCPKCVLRWWDRTGAEQQSDYFTLGTSAETGTTALIGPSSTRVKGQGSGSSAATPQVGIMCTLPIGGTIQGAAARSSLLTEDSAGI